MLDETSIKKKMKIKFYDSLVNRINRIRNTRLNIVMIYSIKVR